MAFTSTTSPFRGARSRVRTAGTRTRSCPTSRSSEASSDEAATSAASHETRLEQCRDSESFQQRCGRSGKLMPLEHWPAQGRVALLVSATVLGANDGLDAAGT